MTSFAELSQVAQAELVRACGHWPRQSRPCLLEPPCDYTEGKLSPWAAWVMEKTNRQPTTKPAPWINDHEDLVSLTIRPFSEDDITIPKAEQLLRSLPSLTRPISFELTSHPYQRDDGESVTSIKFFAHRFDASALHHQLQAHYPSSAVTASKLVEADMDLSYDLHNDGGHAVSLGLNSYYIHTLKSCTDLATDPLGVAITALDNTYDSAMLQVLFMPVQYDWYDVLQKALRNPYLQGPKYIDESITDRILEDKFSGPLFAVTVRLAAQGLSTYEHLVAWAGLYEDPPQAFSLVEPDVTLPNAIGGRLSYRPGFLLNATELAALVHLPSSSIHAERLDRITTRTKAAPSIRDEPGSILLGTNTHRGQDTPARISAQLRPRHCYVAGASGTGKSTLLLNMIKQDIEAGNGIGLLDPHGDLTEHVLGLVPRHRFKDVVYFNPADKDHPPAFNILQTHNVSERQRIITEMVKTIHRFYPDAWGPRLQHILTHALATVTLSPKATILDVRRILSDEYFRQHIVGQLTDDTLLTFWLHEFPNFPKGAADPILNKLSPFLLNQTIRNIICQRQSKFDFDEILITKKIFLANLSTGLLGETVAGIFGTFIMSKIVNAAFRRAAIREHDRVPFYLYVDEFQNFMDLAVGFEQILAEARKYKLVLAAMANQYVGQLSDTVRQAIFGNVGTLLTFRLGVQDARQVSHEFGEFTAEEILALEMGQAICRVGGTQSAFNLVTPPPPSSNDPDNATKIIKKSRQRYTTPREQVEQLFTKQAPPKQAAPASGPTKPKAAKPTSSTTTPPPQSKTTKQAEHISPDLIDDDLV